ncbi:response regulator transcription factor [Viscerimonas tarda]
MRPFILADNQDITREGIQSLLRQIELPDPIREVASRNNLLQELKIYPDAVVVLDYTLFDFSSIDEMKNIRQGHPGSSWLLFSEELGEHFLRYVLLSDSSFNVVMKSSSKQEILTAIKHSYLNESYICDIAKQVLDGDVPVINAPDMLTASEKLVLHEIALGKTTKEIAYEKNLSFHTINTHRKNIFRKLGVSNVHEAIRYAMRAGITDLTEYYI